jgi:hypothetical protein
MSVEYGLKREKVFCFFFSKKKNLPYVIAAQNAAMRAQAARKLSVSVA